MVLVRIVIPTKNEEKHLPLLLESIKKQSFRDYEIVVADAKSTDNTIKIAKRFGCRIARGGPPSIARNNGAKGSKSKILLFIDSDIILENKDFLKTSLDIFQKEDMIAAGFNLKYPKKNHIIKDFYLNLSAFLQNTTFKMRQEKDKPAMQSVMMFDSKVFFKVGGFRDVFAEEGEILQRIVKKYRTKERRFRIISEVGKIMASERRFEKEGYFRYSLKSLRLLYYAFIKGEHKDSKEYFKD